MIFIYRLLMTLSAILYIVVVFLIKENINIIYLHEAPLCLPTYCSYIIYMLAPIMLTCIFLRIKKWLPKDSITANTIKSIESADNSFLPSYLGYFFVALSIPNDNDVIWCVLVLLFVFSFVSQNIYFNPLLLLFGYKFYYLMNSDGVRILMASKQELKKPCDVEFENLRRVNNNTFIED